MANTIKPSGLAVVRNGGLKFITSWKIADKDYGGGQQFRWRIWKTAKKSTSWTYETIGAATAQKTINIETSRFNPAKTSSLFYAFEFAVQGKRQQTTANNKTTTYDWSAWSSKQWVLSEPNRPTVEAELVASNETSFTWEVNTKTADNRPFVQTQYQSFVMKECNETDGSKLNWYSSNRDWVSNTGGASGTFSRPDDSALLANNSWTRWFRIRSRGAAGDSEWKYSRHVYARPYKPSIKKVTASVSGGNTNVIMSWVAKSDAAHPIDEAVAQYSIATPASGLTLPAGASWQTGASVQDTSARDAVNFNISNRAGTDQCLFVRVVAHHDANETPSGYKVASAGALATPSDLAVTVDSSFKATITVTNNSAVPDARVAIIQRDADNNEVTVAVTSAGNGAKTLNNVTVPASSQKAKYIAYAFQGEYSSAERSDGVNVYTINANMTSGRVYDAAVAPAVPMPPTTVTAEEAGANVIIRWDWAWASANQAEITWSTDPNAWTSTAQPQSFIVENKWRDAWRIAGVAPGSIWYFRVRLLRVTPEGTTKTSWSDRISLDRTVAPDAPVLSLNKSVLEPGGKIKASWLYNCDDGVAQGAAEIWKVSNVVNGVPGTFDALVAKATTKASASWTCDETTWPSGETYWVACRVSSRTGKASEWSEAIPFYIGEDLECTIAQTSLQELTITDSEGEDRTQLSLTALPLTATITGAGAGGTTTLIIERAADYQMIRPDGSVRDGFEGETVAIFRQVGEAQITIDLADLIGLLDDGAQYQIVAMVEDGNGQSATATLPFEVHWNHQPVVPTPAVTIEDGVAVISAAAPADLEEGDGISIYRLSADNPQLIVENGAYGEAYVDPYPALGTAGGYRVVAVSKYGDYITDDNLLAWADTPIGLDNTTGYIHFNGETIPINLNVEVSGTWGKDFKETRYLGGTIRGDWNNGTTRHGSISVTIPTEDIGMIQTMRRLADFSGLCHVRTQDGSSFTADVQVAGSTGYGVAGKVEIYTLTITRVAPQTLDGLPYDEYFTE